MEDVSLDRLLSGDLRKLPPLPKRVVRLFISSTFTDMTLERNSLMERVYPRLKKYCRERHGLDFQVVDMRWGVRDEATDDHRTVNLCSREIGNCQRVSLGPNFIALIGDKYGYRPLPNRIKSTEYRLLRRCLIETDTNTDFLDTWYREDLNALPAEYLLQPISSILKNFTNKNEPELQKIDQCIWQVIQERLHELLLIGSGRLVEQGRMSERDQQLKYSISVTEREVIEGCLDIDGAKSQCLVYMRSIVNLRERLGQCLDELAMSIDSVAPSSRCNLDASNHNEADLRRDSTTRKASLKIGDDTIRLTTSRAQTASERKLERTCRLIGRYMDLTCKDGVWHVDEAAQSALKNLKDSKIRNKLGMTGRNLSVHEVHWHETDGISLKAEEHKTYLNNLNNHFYGHLARMIRSAVKKEQAKTNTTGLIGEVLQHSHYGFQVGGSLQSRTDELNQIRAYILTGQYAQQAQGNFIAPFDQDLVILPMFVYGVGGSGKTSVLACVASSAYEWIEQARRTRRSSVGLQASETQKRSINTSQTKRWDRTPCIIMRFCCTTPASSSITGMLKSVCRQLQYNFYQFGPLNGLTERCADISNIGARTHAHDQLPYRKIPDDFVRLVYTFRQLIDNCRHRLHMRRIFVIILDSIERMSAPADSSVEAKYSWLTSITQLPQNVRLVVSCSSTAEGSAYRDFLLLKRHFLQAHYRVIEQLSGSSRDSGQDSTRSSSASGSIALSTGSSHSGDELEESQEYQSLALGNQDRDRSPNHSKFSNLLKRLVLPAMRFKRSSGGDTQNDLSRSERQITVRFAGHNAPPDRSPMVSRTPIHSAPGFSMNPSQRDEHFECGAEHSIHMGLLHVRPLGRDLAVSVLRRRLTELGRSLTQQQWSIVECSFSNCSRPIFVQLALGEVINWKSYSAQGDTKGITFGSAWLSDLDERAMSSMGSNDQDARNKLQSFVRDMEESCKTEEEDHRLKWQMLAMEQQWLNYLDYRTRIESEATVAGGEKNAQDGSQNLEIRIGASGAGPLSASSGIDWTNRNHANSMGVCSSASMSICHLSDTIEDAICQLFARIELQHGYLLTKHSLSYITAARNGICENELEDILSLDDVVLDDVFQYHLPPVRRIPPLLWTRMRNDLPNYLSEREADGIVITWHHNQFKSVTEKRYLNEPKQLVYIHSLMADYFLGTWAVKAKPFRCTKQQIKLAAEQLESAVQESIVDGQAQQTGSSLNNAAYMMDAGRLGSGSARSGTSFSVRQRLRSSDQYDQRLQWMQAKAHRRVPDQPLFYDNNSPNSSELREVDEAKADRTGADRSEGLDTKTTGSGNSPRRVRYNLRKLTELPHHLMLAGRFNELANCVLFNYKWLTALIKTLGLQTLFADLDETTKCLRGKLADCEGAQENSTASSHIAPDCQPEDCTPSDEIDAQAIKVILDQLCMLTGALRLSSSVIHSDPQMLAPQLIGRLIAMFERFSQQLAPNPKLGPVSATKNQLLLAKLVQQCDYEGCSDCALLPTDHCLQSPDGLQLSSLEGHPFGVMSIAMGGDQHHLLGVSSKFIMWNITTGEIAREIDPQIGGSLMTSLTISGNNQLALAHTSDNVIVLLDILTQQVVKYEIQSTGERLLGIKLIEKFGAKRFLVWTASNLLVFSLNSSAFESSQSVDPSRKLEKNSIKLECEINLSEYARDLDQLRLLKVDVDRTSRGSDLIVSTLARDRNNQDESLELVTVEVVDNTFKVWPDDIQAVSLALNSTCKQMIYSTKSGAIYLKRRRATSWSKGKFIRRVSYSSEVPLAIGIEGIDRNNQVSTELDSNELVRLSNFERKIENLGDSNEIPAYYVFNQEHSSSDQTEHLSRVNVDQDGIRFIKLIWSCGVTILQLDKTLVQQDGNKAYVEKTLLLPRDIINVRVGPNESQLMSIMVMDASLNRYLIVASSKTLLFYSVEREQLLKRIDEHGGRITQLLSIGQSGTIEDELASQQLSVASSSMDRTVKIWNLLNINNQSHQIDRLGFGQIDSMSICHQRPLVACLAQDQLSIWDWRTQRIIAQFGSSGDFVGADSQQQEASESKLPSTSFVKCEFSQNGRQLAVATTTSVFVLTVGNTTKQSVGRFSPTASGSTDELTFKLTASCALPHSGLTIRLKFVAQDSRLITIVKCFDGSNKKDSSSISPTSDDLTSTCTDSDTEESIRKTYSLAVACFSMSDSTLQYAIECQVPKCKSLSAFAHQVSGPNDDQLLHDAHASNLVEQKLTRRTKLAAVSCDLQLMIVVGSVSDTHGQQTTDKDQVSRRCRRASTLNRVPLVLNVFSTRDGSLVRSIDLQRLQSINKHQQQKQEEFASFGRTTTTGSGLQVKSHQAAPSDFSKTSKTQEFVCISNDHFNRIKAIQSQASQILVALIDDERGQSFIIDVGSKTLAAHSNNWCGKLSSDGRYGLSRMLASSSALPLTGSASRTISATGKEMSSGGLRLLEMSLCRTIKTVLTIEQLNQLGATNELQVTGGGNELMCGFTKPNNAYVYYCDSRLKRLLLIRLRDSRLMANYKLLSSLSSIKCAAEGYALVLAHTDGSLASLAIVDPQASETLTRLEQYPSRRRLN